MSHPVKCFELDISDTAHFHIIERQGSLNMSHAGRLLKERLTQIRCALVYSHSQIGSPSCPRKLNKDIAHVLNTLTKLRKLWLRTTNRHWMIPFREPLYQIIHRKTPQINY